MLLAGLPNSAHSPVTHLFAAPSTSLPLCLSTSLPLYLSTVLHLRHSSPPPSLPTRWPTCIICHWNRHCCSHGNDVSSEVGFTKPEVAALPSCVTMMSHAITRTSAWLHIRWIAKLRCTWHQPNEESQHQGLGHSCTLLSPAGTCNR